MRNVLLTLAILFCLATAGMAAEQKKSAQPQSKQSQPAQVARNEGNMSVDEASSKKSDCLPKPGKDSRPKNVQDDPEGDPQTSQNQVEYGGGG